MLSRLRSIFLPVGIAFAMTCLFWWPLYGGAGFIGGDLYPYFFPQKAFYADCLKAGAFPLWNDLTGFGYPVLGESQTGAAYPFHLVLYRCLDLNTAYNCEHLLHYILCFLATWLFASRLGLRKAGAALSAIVFTYGWFPPRACLEWAILTGAWMPVALWCAESLLQTRLWRYSIGLSGAIGLQLLAGHYHLAFITLLLIVTFTAFRLAFDPSNATQRANSSDPAGRTTIVAVVVLSIIAGFALAAIQVIPTWELKQRSSRVVQSDEYDPAYGHLPPAYLSQVVAPWLWYSPLAIEEENSVRDVSEFLAPWHWFGPMHDLQGALQRSRSTVRAGTNKIEAHLFCGLVPIGLALMWMGMWMVCRRRMVGPNGPPTLVQSTTIYWAIAGCGAMIYATGILLPIGLHLPGFSFFRGPGRYGIVTTLAVALFAGQMLQWLLACVSSRVGRIAIMCVVFGSTCGDLWLVSRMVRYTSIVSPPRINLRELSPVREKLQAELMPPRLLAPGPNVGNLLGVSCVPWYLGIAPAEYLDPRYAMPPIPKPSDDHQRTTASVDLVEWLGRMGVTHVLSFDKVDTTSWHAEPVFSGVDPFLNSVWGRGQEPIYLYRLVSHRAGASGVIFPGRISSSSDVGRVTPMNWRTTPAETRRYAIGQSAQPGSTLVVTELDYPGWSAKQGDVHLKQNSAGMFRTVELTDSRSDVIWTYRPASVYYGAIISLTTLLFLAAIAHVRFWHTEWLDRMLSSFHRGK